MGWKYPIPSPIQPALSRQSLTFLWKLIYGKIQSSQPLRSCPLGNFCVITLRRKKFTLSCNKLTFSPWCYVPDWMQQKNKSKLPAVYPLMAMWEQGGRKDAVMLLGHVAFIFLRWWIRRHTIHPVRNKNLWTREENQWLIIISKPHTEQGVGLENTRNWDAAQELLPSLWELDRVHKSSPLETPSSPHGQGSRGVHLYSLKFQKHL